MNKKTFVRDVIFFFFLVAAFFMLNGCTTAGSAIPRGGPTMAEIYENAMQQSNNNSIDKVRSEIKAKVNLNKNNLTTDYTRTSQNEINNLFPQLPNPQLVMYVYPHFAGQSQVPVPGYSTAFSLFEKNEYALYDEQPFNY